MPQHLPPDHQKPPIPGELTADIARIITARNQACTTDRILERIYKRINEIAEEGGCALPGPFWMRGVSNRNTDHTKREVILALEEKGFEIRRDSPEELEMITVCWPEKTVLYFEDGTTKEVEA